VRPIHSAGVLSYHSPRSIHRIHLLVKQLPSAEVVVADKGYDSERIRELIEVLGARPVIPGKRNSIRGNADLNRGLYRYRHLVENAFSRLKHYRAVAFRHYKLKTRAW